MQNIEVTESNIIEQVTTAFNDLLAAHQNGMHKIEVLVLGCSSSEVNGAHIGKSPNPQTGDIIAHCMLDLCKKHGIILAVQCCEHLNRALVIERAALNKLGLEEVSAVPHPTAGGSCAYSAYKRMAEPALASKISAEATMDIGDTLTVMHLKRVAIPIRSQIKQIGHAHLTMALTRPPLIGGQRAHYTLDT